MNWRYRHTALLLCMLAFFVTYFARLAISPLVPFLVEEFAISNTLIGVALTGMWLTYGLAQFPSGILADRYGEKRIILIAVGGTSAMSVLLALAPVYGVFALASVGLGGVAGLHYAVATTLLSKTFDNLGIAVGFHSLGGPLAGLVAPGMAAWVAVRYGWRPATVLTVLVGVPIFVLVLWLIRPTEPERPDTALRERVELESIHAVLSRPTIGFTLLVAVAGTYAVQGLLTFFPAFLVAFHGYSPTMAGIAFSVFFVLRAGGQVVLGRASDVYGRDIAIAVSMFAGAAGIGLVLLGAWFPAMVAGILLTGIGSSFFSALDPRFIDALSDAERGTAFGLVRTVYTVFGATGSVGVGLTADFLGWGAAFGMLSGLLCCGTLALLVNYSFGFGY